MNDDTQETPLPEEPVVAGDAWNEVRRIERRNRWIRAFIYLTLSLVMVAVLFVITPVAIRTLNRVEELSETTVAQLDEAHAQLTQAQATLDRLLAERLQLEANIAALQAQLAQLGIEPVVGATGATGATGERGPPGPQGPPGQPGGCVRPNGRPCP